MDYDKPLLLILFFIVLGFGSGATNSIESKVDILESKSLLIVEDSSLLPLAPPHYNDLLDRICMCESGGDASICNKEIGCKGGMGYCGIISGTWNDTLDKMEKEKAYLPERCWVEISLPMSPERTELIFDKECNYLVAEWLLENEGQQHWGTATTEWGSYWCWK